MEPIFSLSPLIDPKLYETQTIIPYKNYNIPFPYTPYDVQKTFMSTLLDALDSKSNALLESPTGTGKTLCLLSSVLTWYASQVEKKPHQKFKVIYASRTHSQLRQVVKELKNTCFKPRVITAASRDQSCINKELEGCFGHQKEIECRKRIKGVQATCQYSQIKKAVNKYLNVDMPILDLQELKDLGVEEGFCPFLFSRSEDYLGEVDMILMPYNYVMDRNIVGVYEKLLTDCVLIVDEAHNIQNVAMDGASMSLGLNMLELAVEELQFLRKKARKSGNFTTITDIDFDYLIRFVQRVQNNLDFQSQFIKNNGNNERMFSGKEIITFFLQVTQMANEEAMEKELDHFASLAGKVMMEMNEEYMWQFDKTTGYLGLLNEIITREGLRNYYRLCYREEDQIGVFELWCIDPSVGFERLRTLGVRNIILTSGTLSPLSSWQSQLKTSFSYQLCNSHVVSSNQVMLSIVQSGPNQQQFTFNYNNRSNDSLNQDVCMAILKLSQNIPNGVVVFFPSNVVMEVIMKMMRQSGLLDKLMDTKSFYFEPRGGDYNFQMMFKDYKRDAAKEKGAVLFAVCRSRVSEGIDLADELCRAVIFVGVPYPPMKDMKIVEKRSYQDGLRSGSGKVKPKERQGQNVEENASKEKEKSFGVPINGSQWYNQQTIRAVNQALGRAIRHKNDYGAIYLLDARYNSTLSLRKQLPKWALQTLKVSNHFETLIKDTKAFFVKNKKLDQEVRPVLSVEEDLEESKKKLPKLSLRKEKEPSLSTVVSEEVEKEKEQKYKQIENKPDNFIPRFKKQGTVSWKVQEEEPQRQQERQRSSGAFRKQSDKKPGKNTLINYFQLKPPKL